MHYLDSDFSHIIKHDFSLNARAIQYTIHLLLISKRPTQISDIGEMGKIEDTRVIISSSHFN